MLGILEDAEWVSKDGCLSWKGKVGGDKPSKEHRIHWDGLRKHNQGRIVQNQQRLEPGVREGHRGFWPQTQWLLTEWDANIVFCNLTYILIPSPLLFRLFCKTSVTECLTLGNWDDFHMLLNFLGQLRGLQTRWKSFAMYVNQPWHLYLIVFLLSACSSATEPTQHGGLQLHWLLRLSGISMCV